MEQKAEENLRAKSLRAFSQANLGMAQRYAIRGRAYIESPKKYYFKDVGLLNARTA